MAARQRIFRVRRNYNQWVANETLEDYALRFTAKKARRWSSARVSNTALGAISFLALEAIGGAITLNYGFTNAAFAIMAVGFIIFVTGLPISYYASKYGIDIDLLTRGAGFGYIGSTITSLIYASFTFIFFALEAAIMALALEQLFGIPLSIGYILSSLIVIPLVTHGITLISRFQLWSQPVWICLQLLPFIYIAIHDVNAVEDWSQFAGVNNEAGGSFNLLLFGAASAVIFSLIAQIGEQVDFLRFLPPKDSAHPLRWWMAMLAAGPGWIGAGILKIFAGSFLAVLALNHGVLAQDASDPTHMYRIAFGYLTSSPDFALAMAGVFVVLSQLKINVTNAYAGSIAWSNFFSRLTHNHPGRVVWLIFNVVIALLLMELGIYRALEEILGVYAVIAVAWVGSLVADLIINKPLGLSPPGIEFKRAYLYDINPVGFGSMIVASLIGISAHMGVFNELSRALAPYITLVSAFVIAPTIAWVTQGRYYIARQPETIVTDNDMATCCICEHSFEQEDIAVCPAYGGYICSLCCTLDARCQDRCKPHARLSEQILSFLGVFLPSPLIARLNSRFGHFLALMTLTALFMSLIMTMVYFEVSAPDAGMQALIRELIWKEYFILLIVAGVAVWLFVLAHESRLVAHEETERQTELLHQEILAHEQTDMQLQKAKELAEAANNAKSRYLTGISHELRSPLNSVMGYAQLLERDTEVPESKREAVNVILRGSEHLSDLIEGLLDISKIEAGRLELHRNEVRLPKLINQLVTMFQLQAQAKGIDFQFSQNGPIPEYVSADEKRLRQILINLLSNAVKYTHQGTVELQVRYRNQVAEFRVVDSGVGISDTDIETIFKPFERIYQPGIAPIPGTGLGLTITRLLTEIMGGEISVRSNPGTGSTFTVSLMLSRIDNPSFEPTLEQKVRGYIGPRKRVLVVDDDVYQRSLIVNILGPLGFEIAQAASAEECLSLIQGWQPDIFLLDVTMPGMSGWELVENVRAQNIKVPIVMISADASEGQPIAERDSDDYAVLHDAYLIKPIRVTNLLERLAALLDVKWFYDEGPKPVLQVPHKTFNHSDLPDAQTLGVLHDMAEIGHLQGLKKQLQKLKQNQTADANFIGYLEMAIQQVRMDRIIEVTQGTKGAAKSRVEGS
ncbi:response regulator [Ketobacter sp. MCCC 1A13808]|uniref:ATP-binding protein n=1 Tax=Ketobacter sp. MCCC 1A13808 TaxID=2602738 RepID=UPI0012EBAD92|nr:ATP-binding protein [Ketobacter sp. MCCC 1A13808]MVF12302.1 response regulator [Ketobacter sp. MCCC 1A13808]